MRDRMIRSLALEALNVGLDAMCSHVQDELGVTDGGIASLHFANLDANPLLSLLIDYIEHEMDERK